MRFLVLVRRAIRPYSMCALLVTLHLSLLSGDVPLLLATAPPDVIIRLDENPVRVSLPSIAEEGDWSDISYVSAALERPDGTVFMGRGYIDDGRIEPGRVTVELLFGGRETRIQSGDVVTLASPWRPSQRIVVPELEIDFDPAAASIIGHIAAGAALTLNLRTCTAAWACRDVTREVTAGVDGAFFLPIESLVGTQEFETIEGSATLVVDQSTHVIRDIARLNATLETAASTIRGKLTTGGIVTATSRTPGLVLGVTSIPGIEGRNDWRVPVLRGDLSPGSHVQLKYANKALDLAYQRQAVLRDVEVEVREDTVVLRADPAISPLAIHATGQSAQLGTRETIIRTDAQGHAEYDLAGLLPDQGGAQLLHEVLMDGMVSRHVDLRTGLRFKLGTNSISGVLEWPPSGESTIIELTLRGSQGEIKAQHPLGRPGLYFDFRAGDASLEAGDRVQLDRGDGDPDVFRLPAISAHYRLEDNTLIGRAAPGSTVVVYLRGGRLDLPMRLDTVAGEDGSFSLSVADWVAAGSPLSGTAEVRTRGQYASYVEWAQPWIKYDLGGSSVSLSLPPGADFLLSTERDGAGMLAEHVSPARPSRTEFHNRPPPLRGWLLHGSGPDRDGFHAGDLISAVGGGASLHWQVPIVTWSFDRNDVSIRATEPIIGATICVELRTALDVECHNASIDESGAAIAHIARERPESLRLSADIILAAQAIRVWHRPPRIEADLDLDTVLVRDLPLAIDAPVLLVERSGAALAEVALQRVGRGWQARSLAELAGGEVIRVVDGQRGETLAHAEVPDFRVTSAQGADVVGFAQQPNIVAIHLTGAGIFLPDHVYRSSVIGQDLALPEADGSFRATIVPEHDLTRAAALKLVASARSGHRFTRRHLTPTLFAESKGHVVCGFSGTPKARVAIEHESAESTLRRVVESDRLGTFRLDLRSRAPIEAGDRITMSVGSERIAITLPELEIERAIRHPNTGAYVGDHIAGDGPPDTPFVSLPDVDVCSITEMRYVGQNQTTATGTFGERRPSVAIGDEQTIAFPSNPNGAYAFRRYVWWGMKIYPDRSVIDLAMSRWNDAEITVHDRDGNLRAVASALTDVDPIAKIDLPLKGPLRPGDVITIDIDGHPDTETVPELYFDWSPGSDLVGASGNPSATTVELRYIDGSTEVLDLEWGEGGRFHAAADVLASRERSAELPLIGFRATLHASPVVDVIVETPGGVDEGVGPELFIPLALRPRGAR